LHSVPMLGAGAFPPTTNAYAGLEILSAQADTYPEARDKVCDRLQILQSMHAEWKDFLRFEDTARSMRSQRLHREIAGEIRGVGEYLAGISKVTKKLFILKAVHPKGTFLVDNAEMSRRRAFLRTSLSALEVIRASFANSQTIAKPNVDRHEAEAESLRVASERFLGAQRQEQQQVHLQQDDILVDIDRSAKRLEEVNQDVGGRSTLRMELLHELEQDVDRETGKLYMLTKKIGQLLNTSDRSFICIENGLVALALLLLFLVCS